MSVKVMGAVWDLDLPHPKQSILLAMADHADHDGNNVFPSVGLVAWKTGYSETQTRRIIKTLVKDGLLVPMDAPKGGTNHYRIDLSKGTPKKPYNDTPVKMTPPPSHSYDTPTPAIAMTPDPSLQPSLNHQDSASGEKPKSPKKESKSKPERNPWSDHTDALFKGMPEAIRPVGVKVAPDGKISGVDYRKHNVKAHSLHDAGFTPEQVFDFVDWLYATNAWYWHGSDGQPVVISMSAVANKIRASQDPVKAWIAQGRPRKTREELQLQEKPPTQRNRPAEPTGVEFVKGEDGRERMVYKWN